VQHASWLAIVNMEDSVKDSEWLRMRKFIRLIYNILRREIDRINNIQRSDKQLVEMQSRHANAMKELQNQHELEFIDFHRHFEQLVREARQSLEQLLSNVFKFQQSSQMLSSQYESRYVCCHHHVSVCLYVTQNVNLCEKMCSHRRSCVRTYGS